MPPNWIRQPPNVVRLGTLAAVLVLVCFAVYGNTLSHGFVYDDVEQVQQNPWLRDAGHIGEILTTNVWQFKGLDSNYYRPMMHLTYLLTYSLFGPAPFGFHLINVLLHSAACLVVLIFGRRLAAAIDARRAVSPTALACATALLFAVHPIHTEAVAWVAGLPELGFSLFSLLALLAHAAADGSRRPATARAAAAACFFLALLYKETAVALALLLPLYDLTCGQGATARRWRIYLPYGAVIGAYLALRLHALGGLAPVQRHATWGAAEQVGNALPLLMDYLGKLVLPVRLNALHVFHAVSSPLEPRALAGLIVTGLLVSLGWLLYRRNRPALFALCLLIAPLLPVLYISGVGENAFAERYLYLPSFGFLLLAVAAAARLLLPRHGPTAIATLVVLTLLASVGTVRRNAVWRDDYTLWSDTARKSPNSDVAQVALGYAALNAGRIDEAIARLESVVERRPEFFEARYNLGAAYARRGQTAEAIEQYRAALEVRPEDSRARRDLAAACFERGLYGEAVAQYQRLVEQQPGDVNALNDLGIAAMEAGRLDEAVDAFEAALRLAPGNVSLLFNLGNALELQGARAEALEAFRTASRLAPGDAEIRRRIARLEGDERRERDVRPAR